MQPATVHQTQIERPPLSTAVRPTLATGPTVGTLVRRQRTPNLPARAHRPPTERHPASEGTRQRAAWMVPSLADQSRARPLLAPLRPQATLVDPWRQHALAT